jgi:hypothetical protein
MLVMVAVLQLAHMLSCICCFDAGLAMALQTAEVIGTLTGHKGQVNCVKWLPQSGKAEAAATVHSKDSISTLQVSPRLELKFHIFF